MRTVFFISDGTGITAETFGKAILNQFESKHRFIRLPFTDGLIGTQRNWFPSYTAGFYTAHGSRMFVSRGLGNSGFSFRLFNRPQIAVLTLTKS